MFYEPDKNNHGLPFSPLKSCVVPRPIGWISTLSREGQPNLAPYSQFNIVGFEPGYVMFSAGGRYPDGRRKDSVVNTEETGEFVYNMATYELRDAVNVTSQIVDSNVDEMKAAGLTAAPSVLVKPPRVAESPINFECKYYTTFVLPGDDWRTNHYIVVGRVVGVHIKDDVLTAEGKIDVVKIRPLARLGYLDYTSVESSFSLELAESTRDFFVHGLTGGR
jgi:flavin reductase (DIM6/NTAB) family NADH-FMN oxidoreductase RutF